MHRDQVMEGTHEDQVLEPGPAALALGRGVVYVASGGGGEASRCRAVPVPRDDGAAQVRRDGLGCGAEVDGQADGGGGAVQGAGAQQRGELAGPGQQREGIGQDQIPDRAGLRCLPAAAREPGSELAEQVLVDPAGEDRHDRRVAGITGGGGGPEVLAIRPHRRGVTGPSACLAVAGWNAAWGGVLVQAGKFFQRQVELDLGRLPGPVRQPPGRDQPPAVLIGKLHRDLNHAQHGAFAGD
jgi:hypothetical protein